MIDPLLSFLPSVVGSRQIFSLDLYVSSVFLSLSSQKNAPARKDFKIVSSTVFAQTRHYNQNKNKVPQRSFMKAFHTKSELL